MTTEEQKLQDEKEVLMMSMEMDEHKFYVDPTAEIEHPPVAISFGDYKIGAESYPTPIGTFGNIIGIAAPPKSTKTFFTSLLTSTFLKGQVGYSGRMKGFREGKSVFHFDTEQSRYHSQRVFKRVLRMTEEEDKGYFTYSLRSMSHDERLAFIEYCLYYKKDVGDIGLVIIDGIADLCSDVNQIDECNKVIQKLMKWSEELNCVIVSVIHTNHNSNKATGHLGSSLTKKVETLVLLNKNEDGVIDVICQESRNFPFDNFQYKINEWGLPVVLDDAEELFKYTEFKKIV